MTMHDYRDYLANFKVSFAKACPEANPDSNAVTVMAEAVLRLSRKGGTWEGDDVENRVACAMHAILTREDVPTSMVMSVSDVEELNLDLRAIPVALAATVEMVMRVSA